MSKQPTPFLESYPAVDEVLRGRRLVAEHYGDVEAECARLRDAAALIDYSGRDLLTFTGKDTLAFLHRVLTQDIEKLPDNATVPAALLVPKGQMVAELWVNRAGDEVWADVSAGRGPEAKAELEKLIVTDDVAIEESHDRFVQLALIGPKTADVLKEVIPAVPARGQIKRGSGLAEGFVFIGKQFGSLPSVVIRVPFERFGTLWPKILDALRLHGGGLAGSKAVNIVRIEQGVPRYDTELAGMTLLPEAGMADYISYTKGCYPGQEVMARLYSRGHVNRHLARLTIEGSDAPVLPATLWNNGKEVGQVTSAAYSDAHGCVVALGYVHRDLVAEGTQLALGAAGGARVTVRGIRGEYPHLESN